MLGMNVNVSFRRKGLRVALRKRQNAKIPARHRACAKRRDNRVHEEEVQRGCDRAGELMRVRMEEKYKGKGMRKCRICGTARALIRSHNLYMCRRCFREVAKDIGFKKYG